MLDGNEWQRSSFCSGGQCVEVAASASGCGHNNCVVVDRDGDLILVRDSKNPGQQPLAFDRAEWETFVAGVEAGQFRDL